MEKMEVGRSGGERDGRRRRIMERGTDRMALITGRVQTVGDSSSLMEAHHSHTHTQSSPALLFQHHPIPPPNFHDGENDPSGTLVNNGFSRGKAKSFDLGVESRLPQGLGGPAMEMEVGDKLKLQPSPFLKHYGIDLTPKEINSCIIASENTRVMCSIVIAFLAVLSNISLPRSIVKSKSIIASKPLYVLLMTDVAIVIGRLVLGKRQRGGVNVKVEEEEEEEGEGEGEEEKEKETDGPNWDGAVKVLELGLVVHQTLRAIFIDCSFYMVIVICGLCLL